MIYGIGTDLVAVGRIEALRARYGQRFARRILTPHELQRYLRAARPGFFLATRFAAKEAAAKALGTGIRAPFTFRNMEVRRERGRAPRLVFSGAALEALHSRGVGRVWLSLSDEGEYALAFVVLGTQTMPSGE